MLLTKAQSVLRVKQCQAFSTSALRSQVPEKEPVDGSEPIRPAPAQMGKMTDIGSRKLFSTDQDMFRESVRKFMREELQPQQESFEDAGQPTRESWQAMGRQGLLGVNISADIGGIGGSFIDEMIVAEEQSYAFVSAPAMALHSTIVMPYIAHYGTKEQQDRYIPAMTAGDCIGSIGMTEPDAGSDLQGIRTNAKKDGSDWIINGSKIYITNGWLTDLCVVVAKTKMDAKRAAHGVSLFLVDADTPGFHKGRKLKKLGLKGQDTAELFFEDVRVPASALLGKENTGFYQLMEQLPQERLLIAVHSIATSEAVFEETRTWVKHRKAFGRHVSDLQTVQHKLAELKTSIAVCRAFIDQCMELHEHKKLCGEMASMAKYWATDLENKVAGDCLQLHGGWGFMWETNIAKAYASSRVQTIYGGTNEIMKELIARNITKQ
ncbi:long-chain specific acyl-CoA dehydrogenase, mitochondrial [Eurytemora carolleeae]|uniref:long-chain specific acyl-CoA dehydrogenase, mitochondrial n=1 Tax=Eurytemora carolleeae TaxID=1294199 RepID=UPI000C7575AF|nr:long-chain specific acyl-CoA dehydrogenase, mitochondrial [Eurytemora carolleeae]|eukprot:XP_023320783.1 long-chain specific acyl-CoA dehydrogenase, mitochondrial-like [Eurytemora affinis]